MTGLDGLAAIGLLLVIEGILPFAAPAIWRDGFPPDAGTQRRPIAFFRCHLDAGGPFFVYDVELMWQN